MAKRKDFTSEAELCDAFIEWAKRDGFTVYPETAGWDILCVTDTGLQLGIQAKLSLNLKVMDQVLGGVSYYRYDCRVTGPDYRAVLVPQPHPVGSEMLRHIGVATIYPQNGGYRRYAGSETRIWHFERFKSAEAEMFDWNPDERCALPNYVPDGRAGTPSPVSLTMWKESALRVLALLELIGSLTRKQIGNCGCNPSRWCAPGPRAWLVSGGDGKWLRGELPNFAQQHPAVYAQVLADMQESLARYV